MRNLTDGEREILDELNWDEGSDEELTEEEEAEAEAEYRKMMGEEADRVSSQESNYKRLS